MGNLEEAVQNHLKAYPFTMAGFHRAEVELIQSAYRQAFRAGAAWGRKDAIEECAKVLGDFSKTAYTEEERALIEVLKSNIRSLAESGGRGKA